MIAFATLFLGLFYGAVPVSLVVAENVAAVHLLLDGCEVARLAAPPWAAEIDLPELAPHELVAVSFDRRGRELSRIRQWINRPRAEAEASFVLEPAGAGAGRVARLVWQSASHALATRIAVTYDGRPLALTDPHRIALPPHTSDRLHFLHAELDFPRNVRADADAILGGPRNEETLTNLTAVPIVLEPGAPGPRLGTLAGRFRHDGESLEAAAIEEGPGEVVFVVAEGARWELSRMEREYSPPLFRGRARLGKDDRFRLLDASPHEPVRPGWPRPFAVSEDVPSAVSGSVLRVAAKATYWASSTTEQRIGDAVGLAGISATGRDRRRAVVLMLGEDELEASTLTPEGVRRFLSSLGVPLFVWSVSAREGATTECWGPARDASTSHLFDEAVRDLALQLSRQRIVWLRGTHPSERIALAPGAAGFRLVR